MVMKQPDTHQFKTLNTCVLNDQLSMQTSAINLICCTWPISFWIPIQIRVIRVNRARESLVIFIYYTSADTLQLFVSVRSIGLIERDH